MKNEKGLIIVVEGPSGVGKDSIVQGLKEKYPNMFVKAPSTTTREMRENESQGNPYFFVTIDEFNKLADVVIVNRMDEKVKDLDDENEDEELVEDEDIDEDEDFDEAEDVYEDIDEDDAFYSRDGMKFQ